MSNKNKITVFPKLFKMNNFRYLYKSIQYFDLKVNNKATSINLKTSANHIYSHRLIPEYFKLKLRDNSFKIKVIPQFNWGYSILLNQSDSIDSYMNRQFNSKKRNIFTRYVRRLEACFDIEYKMFYGEMQKTDYNFIMQSLHDMIIRRFEERNELHKNLHEWDYLLENTYSEIINKNASLFVIYNKDEPIEISLNYHFDKVLFSYLSSYDVDYSKFGLGHVEIYKQTEWCTNHDYILFEMGVGGMDYKRRWSNNVYRYNHYVVFKKWSFKLKLILAKIQLKEYLKSKGLNEISSKLNKYLGKKQNKKTNVICSEIMLINNFNASDYKEIEYASKEYNYLKIHINNFLYTSKNHTNDISTYKKEKSYIIKGKQSFQKISFN